MEVREVPSGFRVGAVPHELSPDGKPFVEYFRRLPGFLVSTIKEEGGKIKGGRPFLLVTAEGAFPLFGVSEPLSEETLVSKGRSFREFDSRGMIIFTGKNFPSERVDDGRFQNPLGPDGTLTIERVNITAEENAISFLYMNENVVPALRNRLRVVGVPYLDGVIDICRRSNRSYAELKGSGVCVPLSDLLKKYPQIEIGVGDNRRLWLRYISSPQSLEICVELVGSLCRVETFSLRKGNALLFGNRNLAESLRLGDSSVSNPHFALACDGDLVYIVDVSNPNNNAGTRVYY